MVKQALRISLIFVLIFLLSGFFQPVFAQSVVNDLGNCSYEIKVGIVFNFAQEIDTAKADSLLADWQKGIESVWANDLTRYFATGCQAEYKFELLKLPEDKTCADYPVYHCINIVEGEKNRRGNLADAKFVIANSGQNSIGEWTTLTTGLNAAHEVGHMMGLRDEYHYDNNFWLNDNFKESGPQSIMAQTWGNVSALAEHTQQILNKIGFKTANILAQNQLLELQNLTLKYYSSPQKASGAWPNLVDLEGALIKGKTDSAVYLVDDNAQLRWLKNEQVAERLIGADWAKKIIYFDDSLIYSYKFGEPIQNL